ncbi:unnamed protein product [Cylicocyclus nassatus]|uniref:Abnormal cell migration protein 18-like fibronectin type I domain-containing protein n=1 Tax=Cylicocyclus nassatus TaxID=53992 RepID=A0AA36H628_CYLNA|nr:unnamed protein product [Cylicocyclus nassatus]
MRALIIIFALIATAYSLCIVNGKRYKENEKWRDSENSPFVKQCKKGKHGWKPEVVECVIEDMRIPRNAHVEKNGIRCYCEELAGDVTAYCM